MHSRGRTDCVGREITADISTRIFPHTRRKPSTQIRRSPQLPIMLPLIAVKIHILPHPPPPSPLSPNFPMSTTTLSSSLHHAHIDLRCCPGVEHPLHI